MSHAANTDLESEAPPSEDVLAFSGLAEASAPRAAPGFSLIDDAEGRFVIDGETGVVSVAEEDLIERERNVVHGVRIRVVEPNGDAYEMAMRLKITGLVPKMAGEEFFGGGEMAMAPAIEAAPAASRETLETPRAYSAGLWTRFAAFDVSCAALGGGAPFALEPLGEALFAVTPDNLITGEAMLALDAPALTPVWD